MLTSQPIVELGLPTAATVVTTTTGEEGEVFMCTWETDWAATAEIQANGHYINLDISF
jgi:hypothetical protein